MNFHGSYDTFENDQQRLDELKAVEAELLQHVDKPVNDVDNLAYDIKEMPSNPVLGSRI